MNEGDRRVRKTRKSIEDAFLSLILEKDYAAITIQDILSRADVGRSTFYAHYRNREEVAVSRFLDMLEHLGLPEPSETSPRLLPVKELFQHVKEMKGLKTFALYGSSLSLFMEYSRRFWSKKLVAQTDYYKKKKLISAIPVSLFIPCAINILMTLFNWWLSENPQPSPEKMDRWYHSLIFGESKVEL